MTTSTLRSARTLLIVLFAVAVVLVALILRPFASALFMGAVLAAAFHPWYMRLTLVLRGNHRAAATLITLGLVVALVLPVATFGVIAIREAAEGFDNFHDVLAREGVEGLIRRVPDPLQHPLEQLWTQLPRRERNTEFVFGLERRAAASLPHLIGAAGQIVVQASLMVIALFFLLLDGSRLVVWLNLVSPLHKSQVRELFTEFRRVSVTVLLGSITTAGAQALAALIGYAIARVPNPFLWTLVTFFVGLTPVVGAGGISLVIAIYLYLSGHTYPAIFLAIWSLLVVGLVDNVVKPLVIKSGIEMHGGIVFFALIGGLAAFGPVGLVLGPLSITLLLAILRIYQRDFSAREEGLT